jgi:N utilization substance protein B
MTESSTKAGSDLGSQVERNPGGGSSSESSEEPSSGRHRGREVALQVLYAIDLGETGPRDARAARADRDLTDTPDTPGAKETRRTTGGEGTVNRAREEDSEENQPHLDPVEASETVLDRITEHFLVPSAAIAFARQLVAGVVGRSAALDELVGQHARNWRVSRMAAVDRNVLRLAVYELMDTETPVAVVIDEAVDLARRFGSDTSPSFVNGVLDAVAREVRAA